MFTFRKANPTDLTSICQLYKKAASRSGGIARAAGEIDEEYVHNFMKNAAKAGIEIVIENPESSNEIIAEVHCYKLIPEVFSHVLGELTIVTDPDFQGRGLGRMVFEALLQEVEQHRPDILRVELIARESNSKAIGFYEKLGFVREGRLEKRIGTSAGTFEADIPMAWFNANYRQK